MDTQPLMLHAEGTGAVSRSAEGMSGMGKKAQALGKSCNEPRCMQPLPACPNLVRVCFGQQKTGGPGSAMKKFQVPDKILGKATKCQKGFACLAGNGRCLSEVEHTIHDAVCYVNCEDDGCTYLVSHGFLGAVCSCPVRVEIFKRHRE